MTKSQEKSEKIVAGTLKSLCLILIAKILKKVKLKNLWSKKNRA